MTAHAKVTIIGHTAAGMGQVWYRVTGNIGVGNVQVAYRVGAGAEDVRRVRFVGAGATAELIGFRPGELIIDPVDYLHIELAFSGKYLTRGVKMQRSQLARVPAGPIHDAVVAAMVRAGLDPVTVFASRDAGNWWRAVSRAAERDRSVSFLTASGVLRAAARSGANVEESDLLSALGRSTRTRLTGPVAARAAGFTSTKINVVALGGVNDHEFAQLAGYAWERDMVPRFIEFMPMGEGAAWTWKDLLGGLSRNPAAASPVAEPGEGQGGVVET
jgi:hypothetical protein